MTVSLFGSAHNLSTFSVLALALGACAAYTLLCAGLLRALNPRLVPGSMKAGGSSRFWALVSAAAVALLAYRALAPLAPRWLFGIAFWPQRVGALAALRHGLSVAALGAVAVLLASESGLAGGLDRWLPRPSRDWPRLAAAGAALGFSWGLIGVCAGRALLLIEAVFHMGRANSAVLLAVILVCGLPLSAFFSGYLSLFGRELGALRRSGFLCSLLLAWLLPVAAFDTYLREAWDLGQTSLSEAAGLTSAPESRSLAVVALAKEDGSPGFRRRETRLSAEGSDATPENLDRVREYVDTRGYRTLFASKALRFLRKGWLLNWSPDDYMDAATMRLGQYPPDYIGFLKTMCAVPATDENYARLERTARAAWSYPVPEVKEAQHTYEGFSAAYARFGDLERSNAWLERIQRLWPLVEGEVRVEPVEERHDGLIAGQVFYRGRPATATKVGLFVLPSTTSVAGATEGLGAVAVPDSLGNFEFTDLPPGRYYLALQGDASLLSEGLEYVNAPGALHVRPGEMRIRLFPIQIERPVYPETEAGSGSSRRK